jgi:hypothetical protein
LTNEEMMKIIEYEIPSDDLDVKTIYMKRTTKQRPDGKEKFEPFEYEIYRPRVIIMHLKYRNHF